MPNAWGDSFGVDEATSGNCVTGVCGTGDWSGPKPGDPNSSNVLLSAVSSYGGIDVSWTYPTINPHAVAHTLVYRGISNDFSLSIERAIIDGNTFFDRIPKEEIREYFYWIKLVSFNGTIGDLIGPVSAVPKASVDLTMEELTGLIDEGYLAQSLRDKIGLLDILNRDLGEEVIDRIADNQVLVDALAAVSSETGEAVTFIQDEVTQRIAANEALVSSINVLAAGLAGNTAAIAEEKTVRVTNDEAAARDRTILYSDLAKNTAAIVTESNTRATADAAVANSVSTLVVQNAALAAAVQTETTTRVSQNTALANQLSTAQTTLGANIVSVQTTMESKIDSVDGKKNNLGALYLTKVNVNDLVGGFGVFNNGSFVEAGFDVDRFWIGRTASRIKPFMIDGGIVYIDKARIRNADIDTLKIAGNAVTITSGASTQSGNTVTVAMTLAHAASIIVIGSVNAPNTGFSQDLFTQINGGAINQVIHESVVGGSLCSFVYTTTAPAGAFAAAVRNTDPVGRTAGVVILVTYR